MRTKQELLKHPSPKYLGPQSQARAVSLVFHPAGVAGCARADVNEAVHAYGGIVFHDGDLTFSLVFPWDRLCAPETIYKNIHRAVHQALKANGVANGLWSPRRSSSGSAQTCFSRPEKMDIVRPDGKKILGGALRKKGAKGLYQGSLRPEVLGLTTEGIAAAVFDGVAREFGARLSADIRREWLVAGRAMAARYRSSRWNERR